MAFRDSLFSSFWGVWHGQGSLWGGTGGLGWCLSCCSSLLCLGALELQAPEASAASLPSQEHHQGLSRWPRSPLQRVSP